MRVSASVLASAVLVLTLASCDGDEPATDAGPGAGDSGVRDSAVGLDDSGVSDTDAGEAADTWTNFADAFVQTYCVECHTGPPRDYTALAQVRRDADTIICGVSPVLEAGCGSFPPPAQFPVGDGPFPSDAERTRFVDWLNAGAPE